MNYVKYFKGDTVFSIKHEQWVKLITSRYLNIFGNHYYAELNGKTVNVEESRIIGVQDIVDRLQEEQKKSEALFNSNHIGKKY